MRAEQLSDDPYLHLQLLGFGVVDEEGEGFLPHRFIGLISDLEEDTNKEEWEGRETEGQDYKHT